MEIQLPVFPEGASRAAGKWALLFFQFIPFPRQTMDRIIDPDGGINCYPDLRSALTKSIYLEMTDPEIRVLRNLRRMNFAQLEHFDPKDPGEIIMADNDPTEGSFVADELLEGDRYKPRARKRYHYNIGKYEEST